MTRDRPKVIILEPDVLQRGLIKLALERNGIPSLVCNHPRDLRRLMVENKPEVLLVDILLREKDGLSLITELGQEGLLQETKAIVISSLAFAEIVQKAVQAGATDFLIKPINVEILVSRVKKIISTKK